MRAGQIFHQRAEQRCQRGFAERAEPEAGERDADLHAGDYAIQFADQVQHDPGAEPALLHQLPHARMAHRHQRKLDRRKKSIHGYESKKSEKSQPNQVDEVPRRPILAAGEQGSNGSGASVCAKRPVAGRGQTQRVFLRLFRKIQQTESHGCFHRKGCFASRDCIRMLRQLPEHRKS